MTGLLLDTHAALWWWSDPHRLTDRAREAIAATDGPIFVSVVSGLEIAIKYRIGKLPDIGDPAKTDLNLMTAHDFRSIAVSDQHALHAGLLPGAHRDPFDRIIAAQAMIEDLTVVTRDAALAGFGCRILW